MGERGREDGEIRLNKRLCNPLFKFRVSDLVEISIS
jgi:hypothetical protein